MSLWQNTTGHLCFSKTLLRLSISSFNLALLGACCSNLYRETYWNMNNKGNKRDKKNYCMTMCGCKFYLLMLIMNFDWVWTLDYPMKTKVRHLDVRCFETLISTRGGTMCFWNYGRHKKEWCFFRTLITTARGTIFCLEPWSAQKEEQCFFGTLISTRGGMVFSKTDC